MNRCLGTQRYTSPCTVTVEPPQTYCWWHDPANAEQRKQAASRGGKRAGRGRPQAELAAIKGELREVIEAVRTGALDKGIGAVVFQGYTVLLRAHTVGLVIEERLELTERMEVLEEHLEQKGGNWYGA
jgi:predicted RNA-binding Zn ribbon-like protein